MINMYSKKQVVMQTNNNKPHILSDVYSLKKKNNKVNIMRGTKSNDRQRIVLATSNGGPFNVIERVSEGNNKENHVYKVNHSKIKEYTNPSLKSISNRKTIQRCKTPRNNMSLRLNGNKSLLNQKNQVSIKKKPVKKKIKATKKSLKNKGKTVLKKKKIKATKKKSLKNKGNAVLKKKKIKGNKNK